MRNQTTTLRVPTRQEQPLPELDAVWAAEVLGDRDIIVAAMVVTHLARLFAFID
jgi:hypothetical protein